MVEASLSPLSVALYADVAEIWANVRTGRAVWPPGRRRLNGGRIVPQPDGTFRYRRGWGDGRPNVDDPVEVRRFATIVTATVVGPIGGERIKMVRRLSSEVPL